MSLFGNSLAEKQVENATSEMLMGSDWGANMEIIDSINRDKDGGKEILKAIGKRMKHQNPKVCKLSLELLGGCVNNCLAPFHRHVSKIDFMDELVKVALKPQQNNEVKETALTLIMTWAEAFTNIAEFAIFWQTYQKLRARGVEFPARDMNAMAPVFTPQVNPQVQRRKSISGEAKKEEQHMYATENPQYATKLKSELKEVMSYVDIVREMLGASADQPQLVKSDETVNQLIAVLKEMQSRLMTLLVELEKENLIELCIQTNDHVSLMLAWHKALIQGQPFQLPNNLPHPKLDEEIVPPVEEKQDNKPAERNIAEEMNALTVNNQPGEGDSQAQKSDAQKELDSLFGAPSNDQPGGGISNKDMNELLDLSGQPQQ